MTALDTFLQLFVVEYNQQPPLVQLHSCTVHLRKADRVWAFRNLWHKFEKNTDLSCSSWSRWLWWHQFKQQTVDQGLVALKVAGLIPAHSNLYAAVSIQTTPDALTACKT